MSEIHMEARRGTLPSVMESHLLKMPKTIASLALIFELIDGGRTEVNEVATRQALGWADYLRSHASRLYSSGRTMAEDGARLSDADGHHFGFIHVSWRSQSVYDTEVE
jgi:hypothetical protein